MQDPDTLVARHAAIEAAAAEIPDIIADVADDLRAAVLGAHAFLEKLGDESAAEEAMAAFAGRVLRVRPGQSARQALEAAGLELVSETGIGQLLEKAATYGENGVLVAPRLDADARAARIREVMDEVEAFDAALPRTAWGIDAPAIAHVARQARGRWALDHGEPVEPLALAIFGGVTERRIRNMMSKGEAGFAVERGRVTAVSALAWLKDRSSFRPSIWRDDSRFDASFRSEPLDPAALRFVPVTDKGEVFHPGLRRDGAYQICDGDLDLQMENYEEALARLQTFQPPEWRRPGPGGRWIRVKGHRWERTTRRDLDAIASEKGEGEQ